MNLHSSIILKVGKGCLIAKSDITSAFRILPIAVDSYQLLGFQWLDNYFFDRCLPMGCSISCTDFEKLSMAK